MGRVRPLRGSGIENIGWLQIPGLLPFTALQLVKQVRIVPCWAAWLLRHRTLHPGDAPLLTLEQPTPWTRTVDSYLRSNEVRMDDVWLAHSRRTWRFAAALADRAGKRDHPELRPELLYVGAMLHDSGLSRPGNPRQCFAVAGGMHAAKTARMAGVDDKRVGIVVEAIASHISLKPTNELGRYLQYGSLLDLTGTRMWHLSRDLVDRVLEADKRDGLPADARRKWREECEEFPHGRAAYARCPGGLVLAMRMAPLPS